MSTPQVFLSYSRENFAEARQLREDLVGKGISVWWDQDILPGQDWKLEIRKAMKQSSAVLLCLSKEATDRKMSGIYPEALDAISIYREYKPGEIYLIPVRFSECEIPLIEIDGTRTLDSLHYVDLFPTEKRDIGGKLLIASLRVALQMPNGSEDNSENTADMRKTEIEISIDRDIREFRKEDQDRLLRALGEFLEIGNVKLVKTRSGSVKLTVALLSSHEEKLLWAIKAGKFEEYGAVDARLTVKADPTKELFISMLTRDLSLRDAIGDLLDNCVDGALRLHSNKNYEGLFVNIEFDHEKDYFQISDNCGGISVENARNYAFRFGRPEEVKESLGSMGYFGIGMKRALFKLGGKFRVESKAENSSFVVEENVSEWAKDKDSNWRFNFEESETGIVVPENERGTTITVTLLHEDVKEAFALPNETGDLREELRLEHLLNIDRGLKITVNGKELKSHALKLLASDQIKTASLKIPSPETLGIEIYAGISEIGEGEKGGKEGGWYLFCNDRLVLGFDQTQTTGWGARKPLRIPEYHPQFYRFRGYVFMEAEHPSFLPWNTAKNGMDEDSPTYRGIKQQMVTTMRPVVDWLNELHRESVDLSNERIQETPLHDAIERAELVELSKIRMNGEYTAPQFVGPQRGEVPPKPDIAGIHYSKPTEELERAKECLEVETAREVGERTFDYFMARECEEE